MSIKYWLSIVAMLFWFSVHKNNNSSDMKYMKHWQGKPSVISLQFTNLLLTCCTSKPSQVWYRLCSTRYWDCHQHVLDLMLILHSTEINLVSTMSLTNVLQQIVSDWVSWQLLPLPLHPLPLRARVSFLCLHLAVE